MIWDPLGRLLLARDTGREIDTGELDARVLVVNDSATYPRLLDAHGTVDGAANDRGSDGGVEVARSFDQRANNLPID